MRDEKVKVLKAISTIEAKDVVRGQFRGYREQKGVSPESPTESFAAVRFEIDSWRWKGVPFYIRAGKCLPVTCTEVWATFREPPTFLPDHTLGKNYMRFRICPDAAIALGAVTVLRWRPLRGRYQACRRSGITATGKLAVLRILGAKCLRASERVRNRKIRELNLAALPPVSQDL